MDVHTTPDGAVILDPHLRTTNPAIYAAGDVTPGYVYVAAAAGTLAAHNAFTPDPQPLNLSVVPGVIFTDPQLATVGLTEAKPRQPVTTPEPPPSAWTTLLAPT